ncbi:MAG: ABC transporter permease [Oscillospiraceae bacterium]|nr:ABC transporter permease [Oscillospiraceae bacterium]
MTNMMKADLYRITKSKSFYIFWAVIIVTYLINIAAKDFGGITFGGPSFVPEDIKIDIGSVAMNFNFYFFSIFPVFGIIIAEFSEHTIKNTITSAISKHKYFLSKYLFAMLYTAAAYLFSNYAFYFINRMVNGSEYSSALSDFSASLFSQLPLMLAIISLFIGLAFLFRKGAAFNAVTIITPIVYSSVSVSLYTIENTRKLSERLLEYDINTMMARLALECTEDYRRNCYLICAAVIVLSFLIGYISFTKRELD